MRRAGIPEDEVFLVLVNGKRAKLDQALSPGDEVTFIPPVAGG
jgi:molybdopterin converting factor small subunit